MTYFPVRLDGLTAAIEGGGYGVDATPTAGANGVKLAERLWSGLRLVPSFPNTQEGVSNNLIWPAKAAAPQGRHVEFEISYPLHGAGSDAVFEADPLVRSCGWAVADGASIFTYTLAATAHESCTIYGYAGGDLWKVGGCRGKIVWPFNPGRNGTIRFLMQGRLLEEPATTSVPTITYDTTDRIAGVNLTLTIGAVTPTLLDGEFDQNCNLDWTEDANGALGLGEYDWSEAQPAFTLSMRKLALATYNPWADEKARTARAISATWGGTQFNRFVFSLPETYVETPAPAESKGFTDVRLRFRAEGSSSATPSIVTS